jgi:hypothetical protein
MAVATFNVVVSYPPRTLDQPTIDVPSEGALHCYSLLSCFSDGKSGLGRLQYEDRCNLSWPAACYLPVCCLRHPSPATKLGCDALASGLLVVLFCSSTGAQYSMKALAHAKV